ncbi:MAG: DUF2239 family protein [Spirochaetales bacterium]|jgi:uncharacterized protein|nr:DUF2239 family protein [Spirochaetales bacterium]
MESSKQYTAFCESARIAAGELESMLSQVWTYLQNRPHNTVIIFDDQTGNQADFDFQGPLEEVLRKALPAEPKTGAGRPKLGIRCREICLLPGQWQWLEEQPRNASSTLRRLVHDAMKHESAEDRVKREIASVGKFMWTMTGDMPGFEEASRALYAGDWSLLSDLIATWPKDIKTYLSTMILRIKEIK